jgi:hypothetical protein
MLECSSGLDVLANDVSNDRTDAGKLVDTLLDAFLLLTGLLSVSESIRACHFEAAGKSTRDMPGQEDDGSEWDVMP